MRDRRALILTALGTIAAFSLLAAGCGGGSSPAGVASVASSTPASTTTNQNRPVVFARCMRSHGVPSYPDVGKPTPQQAGVSPARFQAGVDACSRLLPHGGVSQTPQSHTQLADELSFARCMRRHGVGRFPDPNAREGLTVAMVQAQGVDVHSPAVLRVVQACLPASHGGLTAAKVREALAHAGH